MPVCLCVSFSNGHSFLVFYILVMYTDYCFYNILVERVEFFIVCPILLLFLGFSRLYIYIHMCIQMLFVLFVIAVVGKNH